MVIRRLCWHRTVILLTLFAMLNSSRCGLGNFFEVMGRLPVQTLQTDGAPAMLFLLVLTWVYCSLCTLTHTDLCYCLQVLPFLWSLWLLNIMGTSCLCVSYCWMQLVQFKTSDHYSYYWEDETGGQKQERKSLKTWNGEKQLRKVIV